MFLASTPQVTLILTGRGYETPHFSSHDEDGVLQDQVEPFQKH
jgi:hypothetical protein